MQGISRNRPLFHEGRLENVCKVSNLQVNSLRRRAGNLFARAGNYFDFSTGAGNLARNRSARPDARRGRSIRSGWRLRSTRAEPFDSSEAPRAFFRAWARGLAASTGGEEKAIKALGNLGPGFTKVT